MKTLRLVALSIVVGLFAESGTTCAATYTYSGGNFVDVLGDYTTMMRVTGQFTVAVPLAPNLPFTDITALVTSYSFSDGVQTLTEANSVLLFFSVRTDVTGAIATWSISAGVLVGDLINQISTSFNNGNTFDRGFTDGPCSVTTTDPKECFMSPWAITEEFIADGAISNTKIRDGAIPGMIIGLHQRLPRQQRRHRATEGFGYGTHQLCLIGRNFLIGHNSVSTGFEQDLFLAHFHCVKHVQCCTEVFEIDLFS